MLKIIAISWWRLVSRWEVRKPYSAFAGRWHMARRNVDLLFRIN